MNEARELQFGRPILVKFSGMVLEAVYQGEDVGGKVLAKIQGFGFPDLPMPAFFVGLKD